MERVYIEDEINDEREREKKKIEREEKKIEVKILKGKCIMILRR